ncbi:hypothetical protein Cni_G29430 [Canna indica]|uniref:Uncharacterized protein n=1 Tax=Canna indica TaxID=4628 RepID=A0AAQ3QU00_9LILI|nr:hypothetical protein Cni_G29430 [Canna indica]
MMKSSKRGDATSFAATAPVPAEAAVPWNLRRNRAICNLSVEERNENAVSATAGQRLNRSEKGNKRTFSISLLRAEINKDFLAITGKKASARPKKQPRAVQRQIDALTTALIIITHRSSALDTEELMEKTCYANIDIAHEINVSDGEGQLYVRGGYDARFTPIIPMKSGFIVVVFGYDKL